MMIGNAGMPGRKAVKQANLQLTPTSGLVFGLAISAAFWAVAASMAHWAGLI
jgi:hypothetical protein